MILSKMYLASQQALPLLLSTSPHPIFKLDQIPFSIISIFMGWIQEAVLTYTKECLKMGKGSFCLCQVMA